MTVTAQRLICTKTYCSSIKLPYMPSRSQLTVYGSMPIHRDFQRLDSQTFQHFQGTFTYLETSTGETGYCQGGGAPPCYDEDTSLRQVSHVSSTTSGTSRRWVDSSDSARRYGCRLQTSIRVPVTPSHRLQPTFSSHLVAHAY